MTEKGKDRKDWCRGAHARGKFVGKKRQNMSAGILCREETAAIWSEEKSAAAQGDPSSHRSQGHIEPEWLKSQSQIDCGSLGLLSLVASMELTKFAIASGQFGSSKQGATLCCDCPLTE